MRTPQELLASMERVFGSLARSHFAVVAVLLVVFSTLWNGLGVMPREPYRLVAEYPFARVPLRENTFQESPLLPLISYYTGLTGMNAYNGLALAFVLAGLFAFGLLGKRRWGPEKGLLSLVMTLGHPVTLVMSAWLGSPDGLTFLFTVGVLFVRSPAFAFLLGFLGALAHPTFLFAGLAILLLRILAKEKGVHPKLLLALLGGMVGGTLSGMMYLSVHNIEVYSRLDFLLDRSVGSWFWQNVSWLPHALFSLHGPLWLGLALCVYIGFRRNRTYFATLVLLQFVFYIIAFFSIDTTRIFSLLAWGATIHAILYTLRLAEEAEDPRVGSGLRRGLILIAFVALTQPKFYLWAGEIHGPGFNEFYIPILQQALWRGLW